MVGTWAGKKTLESLGVRGLREKALQRLCPWEVTSPESMQLMGPQPGRWRKRPEIEGD